MNGLKVQLNVPCKPIQKKLQKIKNNCLQTGVSNHALGADSFELSSRKQNTSSENFQPNFTSNFKDNENITGIDGYLTGIEIREDMRERIFEASRLADANLQIKSLDTEGKNQLLPNSKYYSLGEPRFNTKTQKYVYICESLKDMPDNNGLRSKTPLTGKNELGLKFKLRKIKEAGILTIIDIRTKGECSKRAKALLEETELRYINFPVEDMSWDEDDLKNITKFIKTINEGDFLVGCANGQARTDLAVAINYILNPKAKNVPVLYFGTVSSSRVSIKQNMSKIFDIIRKNPSVVEEWGWKNYEIFKTASYNKLALLIKNLSGK